MQIIRFLVCYVATIMGNIWYKAPDNRDAEIVGRNCRYNYSTTDFIAKGAFGAVYKATITERGNYAGEDVVAAKVVHLEAQSEIIVNPTTWAERLARLRKLPNLVHENLVPHHQVCITRSSNGVTLQILMELCSSDLSFFLKEAKKDTTLFSSYQVVERYCRDITVGLHFLHAQGIIHGDLKPGNVLVKRLPNGSRMLLIGDLDDLVQMQEAVTCSGDISQLRGTVRYMSPEMLRKFCTSSDETPGRKTDIWSLGCVILEMAECHVGKEAAQLHVKDGETDNLCSITPAKFASKIIDGYVPFIREDIPVRLAACARLCLQQDPTSRISAIEMLHELPVVTVTVFASNAALGCIQVLNFDPATNKIHAHELRTPGDLEIQIRSFQLSIPKREIVFQTITNDSRTKLYVWNMNTNDWKKSFTPHHYDPVTSDCHFPVVVNDMICYFRFDHGREAREYDFVQEEVCSYFRYDHGHVTREYDFVQEDVCNANAKVMRLFQCNGLNIHISAVAEFEQKLLYAYNYFLDDLSTGLALYDSLSGEWTHLRDLPQARSRFSMAVVNGYVYILGGKVREKPSSYLWIATTTCIRLNIRTAEWESIHHLRKPRCRHLTGFFNDRIYVCGGRNDANEHALEIEVYDTAREEPWSTVALSAQDQQLLRKIILGEE